MQIEIKSWKGPLAAQQKVSSCQKSSISADQMGI